MKLHQQYWDDLIIWLTNYDSLDNFSSTDDKMCGVCVNPKQSYLPGTKYQVQ